MKNIEVKDYFKIDDSHSKIRGFVFLYDENNNIIFKKENMIVKNGRKAILNSAFSGNTITFSKLSFGLNSKITEPDTESLNKKNENTNITLTKSNTSLTEGDIKNSKENIGKYFIDSENLQINIKAKLNGNVDNEGTYSEMGLFLDDTLFSRVVFPAFPLSEKHQYFIDYYIYF